jgi:hypothetical protein
MVDDEFIKHIPEGQDMKIELVERVNHGQPMKREWDLNEVEPEVEVDGDINTTRTMHTKGWEMKISF